MQAEQKIPTVRVSPFVSQGRGAFPQGIDFKFFGKVENCNKRKMGFETVQGYKLPFQREPHQQSSPVFNISQEKVSALDTEIQLLREKRAVQVVP